MSRKLVGYSVRPMSFGRGVLHVMRIHASDTTGRAYESAPICGGVRPWVTVGRDSLPPMFDTADDVLDAARERGTSAFYICWRCIVRAPRARKALR